MAATYSTCYLSHAMSGKTEEQVAAQEKEGVKRIRAMTMNPVLPRRIEPWKHDGKCAPGQKGALESEHTWQCHMRADIAELVSCNAILMMPGWEQSRGCQAELFVATTCGIPVIFV